MYRNENHKREEGKKSLDSNTSQYVKG